MSDLEGAILSDYLLLKCISNGGTADVYRAQQYIDGSPKGNYEVAVKVFRPGYAQRKSFRDYFMAEVETPFTPVPARAGHAWPITPAIQWTSPSSTLGVPTNTSPTQSESGQEASGTSAPQTGNLPGRAHPVVVGVKQVLPAVIVILLLLGLLAALLSSFLYPGGGTHGTSWVSRATYVVTVTSSRGKTWQNS